MKKTLVVFLVILALPIMSFAGKLTNEEVLKGVKKANVIFDVNVNKPELLLFRLKLIEQTVKDLEKYNKRGDIVVAIRGKGSLYVTKGNKYVDEIELPVKKLIQKQIKILAAKNIKLVQCGIATKVLGIKNDDILSEIDVVDNSFITLIGYQMKGYAFVDTMFGR
ncbi:conserved hypothetical protein [Deferribacter desulfuricans SSM1]|uniref:Uncharacterized protein n=1 Tax=Deferribacter desulfuricans (strain DSM 14783 / JCM 11476 / NBRC 101012 / SSM1) TaxID=639282 RepID=D3PB28_DEFDS|nr:DsrE family protein [Deferribacter desulfuricans]BAI79801.1 conserved hypothetical protein [Deferribacter desulfuricans SSM1]